jgi:hypothetical protein
MIDDFQHDVFLSHSAKNKEVAGIIRTPSSTNTTWTEQLRR